MLSTLHNARPLARPFFRRRKRHLQMYSNPLDFQVVPANRVLEQRITAIHVMSPAPERDQGSINSSTGLPALTINMTRRGRFSSPTISSRE